MKAWRNKSLRTPLELVRYDIWYLLKTPNTVSFLYGDKVYTVKSEYEGKECVVNFDDKWYHSRDDFFMDACIGDTRLTSIYDKLYGFEVE